MNEQHVSLDISKSQGVTQMVRIGQGDKSGTTIVATVYDNGTAFDMTGMTAKFLMRTPGNGYVEDEHVNVSGNTLTYVVDEEHCAVTAGVTDECYFQILQGETVIASTARFTVRILRAATQGADPAQSYSDDIVSATNAARQAANDAREAMEEIGTAVEDAAQAAESAAQAVQNAQTAVEDADTAKQAATSAANAATAAANNANSKADLANAAAQSANAATTATNSATQRAEAAITAMGDISEQAVPVMSADIRGGARIQPDSGLEITDTDNLQVRLALESDGTVRGGIAELTAKGHAEQDGTPSPDNPVPIQVVRGRNLLNLSAGQDKWTTLQGSVLTNMTVSDGSVTTKTVMGGLTVMIWNEKFRAGKYAFQFKTSIAIPRMLLKLFDANGNNISSSASVAGWTYNSTYTTLYKASDSEAIDLTNACSSFSIGFGCANETAQNLSVTFSAIQLELGSTPQPYVPYGHVGMEMRDPDTDELISCTALPIPQRGWVAGLPDGTADSLVLDGAGHVEWTLPTSMETFDGSQGVWNENWKPRTNSVAWTYYKLLNYRKLESSGVIASALCSDRPITSYAAMYDTADYDCCSFANGDSDLFVIRSTDTTLTTIANINAYLSEHPITVLYPLATPVIEDCGYVEDWPTDIPEGAVLDIPELSEVGIKYFIDSSVTELAKQWAARLTEELGTAVVELAQRVSQLENA